MAPALRKRKSTNDTNETGESVAYAPPAKKRQPAKKAAPKGRARKKQVEDPDEDNADSGRDGSKIFFTQAQQSKKRKITGDIAKADVQDALEKFMLVLEQSSGLKSTNLGDTLRSHLPPDLDSIMLYTDTHPKLLPKCTPLSTALSAIEQISHTLAHYHDLSTSASIKRPTWMKWEQDHKSLLELNEHALDFAARQVGCMVVPGRQVVERPEGRSDVEKLAWEMFENARPEGGLKMTWGAMAKENFKAFIGVLGMAIGT